MKDNFKEQSIETLTEIIDTVDADIMKALEIYKGNKNTGKGIVAMNKITSALEIRKIAHDMLLDGCKEGWWGLVDEGSSENNISKTFDPSLMEYPWGDQL